MLFSHPIRRACYLVLPLLLTPGLSQADNSFSCPADPSWVSNPNPPEEIPNGEDADFCDFYQFSWQWFLEFVSPSSDPDLRNFQVAADFPILEGEKDGKQQNSCDDQVSEHVLFVRTDKSQDASTTFTIPERIDQAGAGTIYDQQGNVVFYDIRFSRNMCDVEAIQQHDNFPSGTTELKSAWRVITEADKAKYFWMEADIDGVPGTELLGMVGFHVIRATTLHPEFIWATFEHKDNVPDCNNSVEPPAGGWSFTSDACATLLSDLFVGPYTAENKDNCVFNQTSSSSDITGTPTEICRLFPDSTSPVDLKAAENIQAVNDLNTQLVGTDGILSKLPSSNPMAIWANYINVGALWLSDVKLPSAIIDNQRGSMRLANTTMETQYQGGFAANSPYSSNCFGCHNYKVEKSNTADDANLSHIFDDIIKGLNNAQ